MIHSDMLNQIEENIKKLQAQLEEAKVNLQDTKREYDRADRTHKTLVRLLELVIKTREELKAI